jgi:hypothetical protein
MTTTCEHDRERDTCPECGVTALLDEVAPVRPLTDVEEKWVRMKHPEMSEKELRALIAEGLPADVEPITRKDLPASAFAPQPQHFWERGEWDRRRKARKTARVSKRRNRKHAKR